MQGSHWIFFDKDKGYARRNTVSVRSQGRQTEEPPSERQAQRVQHSKVPLCVFFRHPHTSTSFVREQQRAIFSFLPKILRNFWTVLLNLVYICRCFSWRFLNNSSLTKLTILSWTDCYFISPKITQPKAPGCNCASSPIPTVEGAQPASFFRQPGPYKVV